MNKEKNRKEEESIKESAMKADDNKTQKQSTGKAPKGNGKDEAQSEAPKDEAGQIEDLQQQVAELKDKYLRQVAEFDNYRKRTLKEKAELILNGGEKVLSALLPVLDDFDRTEANMEKSDDIDTLRKGVTLISQKLTKILESQGLKTIDAVGKDFNTDFHEAIAMVPAQKDEDKGKVIDCVQKGYMLNEKVIRHAKVAVGQ
jgi:molecular chaperone GrpE